MATFVKGLLSGSSNGRGINVTSTQGTTVTIHVGVTGTAVTDEVVLYANNNFSQAAELFIEFGQSSTATVIVHTLEPRQGQQIVVPGLVLRNSNTADAITAYVGLNGSGSNVAAPGAITVYGYVNRITQ